MRKIAALLAMCLALAGCAEREAAPTPAASEAPPAVYALVVKDTANPYMQRMYEGFQSACRELGVVARLAGPDASAAADKQPDLVEALIAEDVACIAVAANDREALDAPLRAALKKGIAVVSLDSAVDPDCRQLHIQQADPEIIGRALLQAAWQMIGGAGEIALLSTTGSMPNQATWLGYIRQELKENPEKYAGTPIVATIYGFDDYERSARAARALLIGHPDLRILIAPTTVGLLAAADTVEALGSDVLVTGLGLPSAMEKHIKSGLCPWMYLWNPIDMGYLAAYALEALASGEVCGGAGETFEAGSLGEKCVTKSMDGGTEVVLGNPFKFDADNISLWVDAF